MHSSSNRELHPNVWIAAWQPLLWLLFAPSRWTSYIREHAPDLSPFFSLSELRFIHWRNPALRRLLWLSYGLWPLLVIAVLLLVLWSTDQLHAVVVTGLLYGVGMGLIVGLVIGAAAGIAALTVASAAFAFIWHAPDVLLVDMVVGQGFALIYGLTGALTAHVIQNLARAADSSPRLSRAQAVRQLGGFVIALGVSLAIFALATSGTNSAVGARQNGRVADQVSGLLFTTVPAVLMGLAAGWHTGHWRQGLRAGLLIFWLTTLAFGDTGAQLGIQPSAAELLSVFGLTTALTYLLFFTLPFVVVERLVGTWAGAAAGVLGGLAFFPVLARVFLFFALWDNLWLTGMLTLAGLTMRWWRPLLFYPLQAAWQAILLRGAEGGGTVRLSWHPAVWDELQFLPLYGLDEYLVLLIERDPTAGNDALAVISNSRQRWAAQQAQIELEARRLEHSHTMAAMGEVYRSLGAGALSGPASGLLRSFGKHSENIAAGLAQVSLYNRRLVLREVEDALDALVRELTLSNDPYAARFQPIATAWRAVLTTSNAELRQLAEERQELANPYIVGVPLIRRQEIFIGRTDISARIETFLQNAHHPPLLLYGQRRMGKTSLLYQLRWLLPSRIAPLVVDLQGPVALAADHSGFLYNFAKGIVTSADSQGLSLPPLTRQQLASDPFTVFDDWLDEVERALTAQERSTILLALDEFEALDEAISTNRLGEQAVLGTFRHILQHRPRFKLLLAGSHTLTEFRRWSSYLINAQTIHLSYLNEAEARQLIEQPTSTFALSYDKSASQRIFDLTRGHPYLVQLLCSEIVTLKNEQEPHLRRHASLQDVEAAVPEMLTRGGQFFADIELNQVDNSGLAVLRWLAKQGEGTSTKWAVMARQFTDEKRLTQTLDLLIRRELIEEADNGYRFQVEAIRHWFARPAHGN